MSIQQTLVLLLLIVNSVIDLWKKKISMGSVLVYGLFWLCFCMKGSHLESVLLGMLPGLIMMIVGKITRGAIGMGDGILLMSMGLCLVWEKIVVLLIWAFLLAFGWAVIQFTIQKKNGKSNFPFVPFLLMGYILVLLM